MTESDRDRGQLVLLAAAAIAVALVPLALAYVGLGYHPDVGGPDRTDIDLDDTVRMLDRATHDAAAPLAGTYDWGERERAVATLDDRLGGDTDRIEQSQLSSGVAYRIERNTTAATRWADRHCPSGPDRSFGSCEVIDGVVVQMRAGETAIVAVAFDIHATGERQRADATAVIRINSA